MDFYIDIGFAVLLRLLKDRKQLNKFRTAFAKLVRGAIDVYGSDPVFREMAGLPGE